MSSADAPSAAVRTMTPPFLTSSALTMSAGGSARRPRAGARRRGPSPLGTKTTKRPGQRDLRRQPRALRLHRVLDRLDEDVLAAADQVLDLACRAGGPRARGRRSRRRRGSRSSRGRSRRTRPPSRAGRCRRRPCRCCRRSSGAPAARGRPRRRWSSSRTATRCSPTSTETSSSRFAAGSGAGAAACAVAACCFGGTADAGFRSGPPSSSASSPPAVARPWFRPSRARVASCDLRPPRLPRRRFGLRLFARRGRGQAAVVTTGSGWGAPSAGASFWRFLRRNNCSKRNLLLDARALASPGPGRSARCGYE